ncbi:UTP--glucose-1-phosphate uridylyltransferase [Patescibacteria group bacterium AH-259-L05]|nr:UTP--glucose-1-phosphate uridylyltransferase [Patescibacteria group bacterium AH-259-L05]
MKITKAIIPVAGLGTRFLPATKSQPKEMLTVVDKPVIHYVVEEAVKAGIKQIFLITSSTKRAIEDYFDYNFELEYWLKKRKKIKALKSIRPIHHMAEFVFIRQREPKGFGDAILCAYEFVKDEPCVVMLGDDIIDSASPCIGQLIDVYKRYGDPVVAVKRVKKSEIKYFGSVGGIKVEDGVYQLHKIVEKPKPEHAPSLLGIVGRYIITPEILEVLQGIKLPKGKEFGLVEGFDGLLRTKRPAYACEFKGAWYTVGSKQSFLEANIALGLKDKEINKDLRKFLRRVNI